MLLWEAVDEGAGGRIVVNAGESTDITGGSVSLMSGYGTATSSGAFTDLDCGCWIKWRER